MVTVGIGASLGILAWLHGRKSAEPETYVPRPRGEVTFNKDIAPIIFQHCAACHRPGQSAPFSLLNYADAKKRADDIAKATARGYMPPWLPEGGYATFVGERRLATAEIDMIQQWVADGAIEGAPADLPALPAWSGDWQLGEPDLVVTMPEPYLLSAEGRDVYRNFVIRVPLAATRYVRGVELRSGNPRVVHHAFIKVDPTAQSRRLDAEEVEPGFAGMNSPAKMPDGHFLGWQPGRLPTFLPDGLAWRLNPGDDLVVEMHLNPSGKPEQIQSGIGLFFTDRPPTNTCFKMALTSYTMDIPAGAQNYVVQDSYQLPADVSVLAVLPHAHYLAREMHGWATLPNGTKQSLLFIKQWDFNWQGDYRYAQPVFLPKGTILAMRFTYDNSTNNVRNPNHPPKTVNYGSQSSDEMAELWFQLLPHNASDLARLTSDYQAKLARLFREHSEFLLHKNPNDAKAHADLGLDLLSQGRLVEAERHFRAALQARPDFGLAHYRLGLLFRQQNRLTEARAEFETALRLDPDDSKAHGNLGFIFLQQGELRSAQSHFESALALNPDDTIARNGLAETLKARRQLEKSN
ncbi:MAG TPA: tetratricopeptide repeat protein [Verrucomicrobiae bacterium]|nr:tetratricopeptide repeat protein [Verrucomicrobiae bacterium]